MSNESIPWTWAYEKSRKRVNLKPGESKVVTFDLDKSAFAYHDSEMKYIVEAGEFNILIGNSSRSEDLKNISFSIEETIYIKD